MSTAPATIATLLERLVGVGDVAAKSMFGEFGLYVDGRMVASVCDDTLFVKPTAGGRAFLSAPDEAPAYPGAKPSFRIAADRWDDSDWLRELVRITAREVPTAKPRKKPAKA